VLPPNPNTVALKAALQTDVNNFLSARAAITHISTVALDVNLRGQAPIDVSSGTTTYGGTTPVTPANLFQIGSYTKAFTAAAILQLEAAGKLSIHDTVGKWLPQYPQWSSVRIESLLNMTSGIPGYDNLPAFETAFAQNPNRHWTLPELAAFSQGQPLEPGWLYSNTNYILAEMIVEQAGNDDYTDQLYRRFFIPLGLQDAYYYADSYPATVVDRLVSGYFYNAALTPFSAFLGKDIKTDSLSWAQGAGGIVASLANVSTWSVRRMKEVCSRRRSAKSCSASSPTTPDNPLPRRRPPIRSALDWGWDSSRISRWETSGTIKVKRSVTGSSTRIFRRPARFSLWASTVSRTRARLAPTTRSSCCWNRSTLRSRPRIRSRDQVKECRRVRCVWLRPIRKVYRAKPRAPILSAHVG
jgi:CubicO group peptidase (beta-lactamase class C family)